VEILSYRKSQCTVNNSIRNQSKHKFTIQKEWYKQTSVNIIKIKIKQNKKQKVKIKILPCFPINRPKQNIKNEDKNDNKSNPKYI